VNSLRALPRLWPVFDNADLIALACVGDWEAAKPCLWPPPGTSTSSLNPISETRRLDVLHLNATKIATPACWPDRATRKLSI